MTHVLSRISRGSGLYGLLFLVTSVLGQTGGGITSGKAAVVGDTVQLASLVLMVLSFLHTSEEWGQCDACAPPPRQGADKVVSWSLWLVHLLERPVPKGLLLGLSTTLSILALWPPSLLGPVIPVFLLALALATLTRSFRRHHVLSAWCAYCQDDDDDDGGGGGGDDDDGVVPPLPQFEVSGR